MFDHRSTISIITVTILVLAATFHTTECNPLRTRRAFSYIANETACTVDHIIYRDGDPIPTDDPCETCRCRPPGFSCVLRECEIKTGCRAIRRIGECCPQYQCGCEHNGKYYHDGERIANAESPCYSCYCQGSSITCSLADCKFRFDCEPEYIIGECCPRYEHCLPDQSGDYVTVKSTDIPILTTAFVSRNYSTTTTTSSPITTTSVTTEDTLNFNQNETTISDTYIVRSNQSNIGIDIESMFTELPILPFTNDNRSFEETDQETTTTTIMPDLFTTLASNDDDSKLKIINDPLTTTINELTDSESDYTTTMQSIMTTNYENVDLTNVSLSEIVVNATAENSIETTTNLPLTTEPMKTTSEVITVTDSSFELTNNQTEYSQVVFDSTVAEIKLDDSTSISSVDNPTTINDSKTDNVDFDIGQLSTTTEVSLIEDIIKSSNTNTTVASNLNDDTPSTLFESNEEDRGIVTTEATQLSSQKNYDLDLATTVSNSTNDLSLTTISTISMFTENSVQPITSATETSTESSIVVNELLTENVKSSNDDQFLTTISPTNELSVESEESMANNELTTTTVSIELSNSTISSQSIDDSTAIIPNFIIFNNDTLNNTTGSNI